MADQVLSRSAINILRKEFQCLVENPVEGFRVKLIEDNLAKWEVALFGPPDTLYVGGYFKAVMEFPRDYPFSPPSVRFLSEVFHPNVYADGRICISILLPPGDDPQSGVLPCERWNATQTVRTILLSIISLLSEPNTSPPANIEASLMYRRYQDERDGEYQDIIRELVRATKDEAAKDRVIVPTSTDEYCLKYRPPVNEDSERDNA